MGRKRAAKNGLGRGIIEARIKELLRREDEAAKQECVRLAALLLPYEMPKLQAVMARTTLEAGDSLSRLLREIDGKTVGITRRVATGGPLLAIEQSVCLPDEDRIDNPVQDELGAAAPPDEPA
jgi:hypothetical protein